MKYYTTLIFDFDGTIADSFSATYESYNVLAAKHNLKPIRAEDLNIVRTMKPMELLAYCQVPLYKIPFLLAEGRQLIKSAMKHIHPFDGMVKTLSSLHKHYTMGILTSNSEENVKDFIASNSLDSFFSFIHSEKNLFGKHKALERIITERNVDKEKTLYIGDEVRDIESCKKIDLPIVSVAWGFNEAGVLEKQTPTYLVHSPEELLHLLSGKHE